MYTMDLSKPSWPWVWQCMKRLCIEGKELLQKGHEWFILIFKQAGCCRDLNCSLLLASKWLQASLRGSLGAQKKCVSLEIFCGYISKELKEKQETHGLLEISGQVGARALWNSGCGGRGYDRSHSFFNSTSWSVLPTRQAERTAK